jgi:hypothetical protein
MTGEELARVPKFQRDHQAAIRDPAPLRADQGSRRLFPKWASIDVGGGSIILTERWRMTSGGLGTMGYGLPAAVGVQLLHPGSLVIHIAGRRRC